MTRKQFLALLLTLSASTTVVAEVPRWIHDAAISPDGSTVAFSYKGDIFTVPVAGGQALQITSNDAYEGKPVWSPDSKNIVFLSNREGSDDLFITSAKGGTPRRLTTHSGSEFPLTFLNDNTLLFTANILPGKKTSRAPFSTQLYTINTDQDNSRPRLYLSLPVVAASANSEGKLLYQDRKGYEDVLRKHERSSVTGDIWLYDNGKFRQLTTFNGGDQSPAWGKGDSYY
ncbi:MAG: peptidase S41, partial [Muribaculaceae bacterium]|nr:peptidase S41 [Muribaculaceae bacterium]